MRSVRTVTGDVGPEELGLVLMHEHVITRSPGVCEDYPSTYPRSEVADQCVQILAQLRRSERVATIIDHTTVDLGRDVRLLADVSRRSGVRIVAATGLWLQPPIYFRNQSPQRVAEMFTRDIEVGFADTGIRAGIVKCAVDRDGLVPAIEVGVRAAAMAHRATGVPLSTHTTAENRTGELLIELLLTEGVDMRRVVIGHSGDSHDDEYLHHLLATGAFLGMDRFGWDEPVSDASRVRVVAELCREGFSRQLMLSHDATAWSQWRTAEIQKVKPNLHFRHLFGSIIPALRDRGVTELQISEMLVDNPRRLFSMSAAY